MKRENFLLVTVTNCTALKKKGSYRLGIKLGKNEKLLNWTKKTNSPGWYAGAYFAIPYESITPNNGLYFNLYKRGFFGFKSLVATHKFDQGRINFYGCYNDYIQLSTKGKKPEVVCTLKVRVQYVRCSDYFTCPSCSDLRNIQGVTLTKPVKNNCYVELSCGKFNEETEKTDGSFSHHFMCDPSLLTKKTLMAYVYNKRKELGCCSIDVDSLQAGNWCELTLPIRKGKKEVGKLQLLCQMLYECCECIVEREDEEGNVDIPTQTVAPQTVEFIPGMGMAQPMFVSSQPIPMAQPIMQPIPMAQPIMINPMDQGVYIQPPMAQPVMVHPMEQGVYAQAPIPMAQAISPPVYMPY